MLLSGLVSAGIRYGSGVGWDDMELRAEAYEKLSRARELQAELHQAMHRDWWDHGPLRLALEQPDEMTIELVAYSKPVPPLKRWWSRTADVVSNLRAALDHLHMDIARRATGSEPGVIYFPITRDPKGWKDWLRQNASIPAELRPRYLSTQPWMSGRPFLSDLARLSVLGKHRGGVTAAVALTKLDIGFQTTIEGLPTPDELEAGMTLTAGTIEITQERQVISTSTTGHRVLSIDAEFRYDFTFTPHVAFDDQAVPIESLFDAMTQEVAQAIAIVAGSR
jgi:hypothetical protein